MIFNTNLNIDWRYSPYRVLNANKTSIPSDNKIALSKITEFHIRIAYIVEPITKVQAELQHELRKRLLELAEYKLSPKAGNNKRGIHNKYAAARILLYHILYRKKLYKYATRNKIIQKLKLIAKRNRIPKAKLLSIKYLSKVVNKSDKLWAFNTRIQINKSLLHNELWWELAAKQLKLRLSSNKIISKMWKFYHNYKTGKTHKVDIPKFPSGIRTLTISPIINRIYEGILNRILVATLNKSYWKKHNYAAFTKGGSLKELYKIKDNLKKLNNTNTDWTLVALDITKAFDTIELTTIMHNLKQELRGRTLTKSNWNFLKKKLKPLLTGRNVAVPQGAPCSSLLYVVGAQKLYKQAALHSKSWYAYIDDLILLYPHLIDVEERITHSTNIISNSTLKFNHNKTEFIHSNIKDSKSINLLGHALKSIGIIGPYKPRLLRALQKALLNSASLWTTELDADRFKIRLTRIIIGLANYYFNKRLYSKEYYEYGLSILLTLYTQAFRNWIEHRILPEDANVSTNTQKDSNLSSNSNSNSNSNPNANANPNANPNYVNLADKIEDYTSSHWRGKLMQITAEQAKLHSNLQDMKKKLNHWTLSVNIDLELQFKPSNKFRTEASNDMFEYSLWLITKWVFMEPRRESLNQFLSIRQKEVNFKVNGTSSKALNIKPKVSDNVSR